MHYYLSLGANLGNREQTINEALHLIEQQIGTVLRRSSFYYSAPWGFESEHAFCNACCLVQTELAPLNVLHQTQQIERTLGRTTKSNGTHYTDRTIDIDLIRAFDGTNEIKWNDHELTLPHAHWQERAFVVEPLKEIIK